MTQVHLASFLPKSYTPLNTTPEATFRQEIITKYLKLKEKKLSTQEALDILGIKRSTFYRWFKIYNEANRLNAKTTSLKNKSRRPHNFRKSKVLSFDVLTHILKIRQECASRVWSH